MANLSKNQTFEIVFPADSADVISQLVEKYGLEDSKTTLAAATAAQNPGERKKILAEMPGRKIAKMVRDRGEGTLSPAELINALQKDLSLSKEAAKKMADDLEQKIIARARKVLVSEEEETTGLTPDKKSISTTKKIEEEITSSKTEEMSAGETPATPAPLPEEPERRRGPRGPDAYRESAEEE